MVTGRVKRVWLDVNVEKASCRSCEAISTHDQYIKVARSAVYRVYL